MANKYHRTIGDMLTGAISGAHKGKPIEPPSAPPPQSKVIPNPFELLVPYSMQEFPRTFLHLLKVSPQVPHDVQAMISTWLEEYDQNLFGWLENHYGPGVERVCDILTREVMKVQHLHAEAAAKETVDTVIDDLEKSLEDGDEGRDGTVTDS